MEPRDFGQRSGLKVAPVSIGAMRLPGDALDAVELIRLAIDSGMRYIDTSRGYNESEFILGRALKKGYRERVLLSSKCSPWIKKISDTDNGSADSVRRRIDETLLRLDTDYLDFYQVWNVNSPDAWSTATRKGGMVDGILKAVDEGLVRHIGFTSHEKPELLVKYLDEADWCEVLLVTYNLLCKDYTAVLEAAHRKGIGTAVMNPVGGGKFADPNPVTDRLVREVGAHSLPDLAIRYVLANPDVDTMLCGMSKTADVEHSIDSAHRQPLTPEQIRHVDHFFQALSKEQVKYCTGCGYCKPCPAGVEIPQIMGLVYDDRFLGFKNNTRRVWKGWMRNTTKAEMCKKCGLCETKCTQGLKIVKEIEYALAEYV